MTRQPKRFKGLSETQLAVFAALANGRQPSCKEWRTVEALLTRGLFRNATTTETGGYRLTDQALAAWTEWNRQARAAEGLTKT